MGYLLPIQYTQYQEYQNRIKRVKTNEFRTNSVDQVKRIYLAQKNKFAVHLPKNKVTRNMAVAEKVYADLTGIGRNFDESI
jgi:hypothetical protein